jgi:hypothetical protein
MSSNCRLISGSRDRILASPLPTPCLCTRQLWKTCARPMCPIEHQWPSSRLVPGVTIVSPTGIPSWRSLRIAGPRIRKAGTDAHPVWLRLSGGRSDATVLSLTRPPHGRLLASQRAAHWEAWKWVSSTTFGSR